MIMMGMPSTVIATTCTSEMPMTPKDSSRVSRGWWTRSGAIQVGSNKVCHQNMPFCELLTIPLSRQISIPLVLLQIVAMHHFHHRQPLQAALLHLPGLPSPPNSWNHCPFRHSGQLPLHKQLLPLLPVRVRHKSWW